MDDLVNLIQREVARAMAHRTHMRVSLCTGYDPKTHTVKLKHQPDGTESGWTPIGCSAAGQAISHVHGPTPGDGVKTGDQAIVGFLDGDMENPVVLGWLHSDKDPPPEVKSGQTMLRHQPQKKKQEQAAQGGSSGSSSGGSGDSSSSSSSSGGQDQKEHKPVTMFWDENGKITFTGNDQGMSHATQDSGPIALSTPDKGTITVDAKKGTMTISADKSISVKSKKKIEINADKGQINVTAKPVTVDDLAGQGTVTPDPDTGG